MAKLAFLLDLPEEELCPVLQIAHSTLPVVSRHSPARDSDVKLVWGKTVRIVLPIAGSATVPPAPSARLVHSARSARTFMVGAARAPATKMASVPRPAATVPGPGPIAVLHFSTAAVPRTARPVHNARSARSFMVGAARGPVTRMAAAPPPAATVPGPGLTVVSHLSAPEVLM